jgi:hypothetical protein
MINSASRRRVTLVRPRQNPGGVGQGTSPHVARRKCSEPDERCDGVRAYTSPSNNKLTSDQIVDRVFWDGLARALGRVLADIASDERIDKHRMALLTQNCDVDFHQDGWTLTVTLRGNEDGAYSGLKITVPAEDVVGLYMNAQAAAGRLDDWLEANYPEVIPEVERVLPYVNQARATWEQIARVAQNNKLDDAAYNFSGPHFPVADDLNEIVAWSRAIATFDGSEVLDCENPEHYVLTVQECAATLESMMPWLRCAAVTNASVKDNEEFVIWFRELIGKPREWTDPEAANRTFRYTGRMKPLSDGAPRQWHHGLIEVASEIQWVDEKTDGATSWHTNPEYMLALRAHFRLMDLTKEDEKPYIKAAEFRDNGGAYPEGVTRWVPIDGLKRTDAARGCISLTQVIDYIARHGDVLTDSSIEACDRRTISDQSEEVLRLYGYDDEMLTLHRAWQDGCDSPKKITGHLGDEWDKKRLARVRKRIKTAVRRFYGGRDPQAASIVRCAPGINRQYLNPPEKGRPHNSPGIWTYAHEFDRGSGVMDASLIAKNVEAAEGVRNFQRRNYIKTSEK